MTAISRWRSFGSGVFVCWAKVGKATPIANANRAAKHTFIFFSRNLDWSSLDDPAPGISQAPGTSVSRGVRKNALAKTSERHPKGKTKPAGRQVGSQRQNAARDTSRRNM